MFSVVVILAGVGTLVAVAVGILAVLIVGIRRGDRGHLANTPKSHPDAIARRILVGIRYPSDNSEGDDQNRITDLVANEHAPRHCTAKHCGKCSARARWYRRKAPRASKITARKNRKGVMPS